MKNSILNYLSNSKVVIIDDREEEAKPLINGLKKKGIPTLHIKKIREIEETTKGIRLVFLDIDLISGVGASHDRSGTIVGALENLIDKDNGPYIIVVWSKQANIHMPDLIARIKGLENLEKDYLVPIEIVELEKPKYIQMCNESLADQDNDIQNLIINLETFLKSESVSLKSPQYLKIKEELEKYDIVEEKYELSPENLENLIDDLYNQLKDKLEFQTFLAWENMIKNEIINQGNEFLEKKIINDMGKIFYNLAKAKCGKQLEEDVFISGAYNVLNDLLCDKLESKMEKTDELLKLSALFKSESGKIDEKYKSDLEEEMIALLNTKLLISNVISNENIKPGIIYLEDEDISNNYKSSFCSSIMLHKEVDKAYPKRSERKEFKTDIKNKMKVINLEISPACDYSQNKIKNHRILRGVLVPKEAFKYLSANQIAYYTSPEIYYNNQIYKMVFSFQELYTQTEISTESIIYKLKKDLLKEIQVKLSNHISRLGITSL